MLDIVIIQIIFAILIILFTLIPCNVMIQKLEHISIILDKITKEKSNDK